MTDAANHHRRPGRQRTLTVLALAAAVAGIIAIVLALAMQDDAPRVPPGGLGTVAASTPSPSAERTPEQTKAADKPLLAAPPESISIPAIDVQSEVIKIGKNPDGTLAAPEGANIDKAAWFTGSVTPGQIGPSVIEGHVDTVNGPSVFFNLAKLNPGDEVRVERSDRKAAIFEISAVRSYSTEGEFPKELIYGGDLGKASLRLITCSNFNTATGHYDGNTVIFAELASVKAKK